MRPTPTRAAAALLVAAIAAACAPEQDATYTGGLGEPCNPDGSCVRGLICIAGFCRPTYGGGDPLVGDPGPGDDSGGDNNGGDNNGGDNNGGDNNGGDNNGGDEPPPPLTCLDGGVPRPVVVPAAAELVVSEAFPDPAGADDDQEWVEVYVAGGRAVDLNGLTLVNSRSGSTPRSFALTGADCLRAAAGAYVVVAASLDPGVNGGLSADVALPGLSLFNGAAMELELRAGALLIDRAALPAATSGVSVSLDPLQLDAAANDQASVFCAGTTTGLFAGAGTPGAANDLCPWSCLEGGTPRAALRPAAGELVITELLADPSGTDAGRDWFEVYVAAGSARDLNGLEIVNQAGSTRRWSVTSDACLTVSSGTYAVFAGPGAGAEGVTPAVVFGGATDTLLLGVAASLALELDGALIDAVSYPAATAGVSHQLDVQVLDAAVNDAAGAWCAATAAANGFSGGLGSPGVANEDCP